MAGIGETSVVTTFRMHIYHINASHLWSWRLSCVAVRFRRPPWQACVCVWRLPSLMKSFNLRAPPSNLKLNRQTCLRIPSRKFYFTVSGFPGGPEWFAICNSGRVLMVGEQGSFREVGKASEMGKRVPTEASDPGTART